MARISAACAVLALSACTKGINGGAAPVSMIRLGEPHAPTTITIWTFHKLPNEVAAFKNSLAQLKKDAPWLTVNFVANKDDVAFAKAVAAGQAPDILISWGPDNAIKFCENGTVADMAPYMKVSHQDPAKIFPHNALRNIRFNNRLCGLPLLTDVYGLFYDKKAFREAGITRPPRTMTEMTEVAKKLTKRDASGKVTRFGFVPNAEYSTNVAIYDGVYAGTSQYDENMKARFGTDPRWKKLLEWNRDLVSFYGADQTKRFVGTYNAHTDDARNPLLSGAAAMELDGEWHIGEAKDLKPDFELGVAPFPVLDSEAASYGVGSNAGSVIYLPAGAKHRSEAFFAANRLATDTRFLNNLADTVSNIPTTYESLAAWKKAKDPLWKPLVNSFRQPIKGPPPLSAAGTETGIIWLKFLQQVQDGQVTDIAGGLNEVAKKFDETNAEASR